MARVKGPSRPPPDSAQLEAELRRAAWESAIRTLRAGATVLTVGLLALGGRALVDGFSALTAVTTAVVTALLAGSVALLRQGRRMEPPEPSRAPASGERRRDTRAAAG